LYFSLPLEILGFASRSYPVVTSLTLRPRYAGRPGLGNIDCRLFHPAALIACIVLFHLNNCFLPGLYSGYVLPVSWLVVYIALLVSRAKTTIISFVRGLKYFK
jgi:hypothetical protein